jgi:S1/P1 Nuclease
MVGLVRATFSRVYPYLSCLLMVISLLWSSGAQAWNATGHRLVAHIAWANLTPSTQKACAKLLTFHPDYLRWAEQAEYGRDVGLTAFVEASIWADEIRRDARFRRGEDTATESLDGFPDMERHSQWHYADAQDGAGEENLYVALPKLYRMLSDAQQRPASRAFALVWLLHLVGDAHQPLHNGFREDRGGNEVPVLVFDGDSNRSTNLHAFWDDLPGKSSLRGTALIHWADALLFSENVNVAGGVNFSRWQAENLQISQKDAYPAHVALDGLPTVLSTAFTQRARVVANRQLVVAGRRLALVLETALAGEREARRTPFVIERRPVN